MSYIVFARKYRPQVFDDIVGQSHITTTLKNAISQNRTSHAYLFTGPRGVGKTTTARILAKALNCEKGLSPDPCNKCHSCLEISQGTNLDVLEIDGASNRGIDEIRALRENVKFSPSKGRFKVYIIDEVHMLTDEAFNALLKTLEEPPAHVKFIFATTRPHKVPSTILSRCQRFDFRRISTKGILENLNVIIKKEGLNINEEALAVIAKHSDGSMRDAQVVLDQMMSFAKGKVKAEDVTKMLGIVDDEVLFGLSEAIIRKDAAHALKIIDSFANEGKDITHVALSLIEHFRDISIIKVSNDLSSLVDAGPEKLKRYESEAGKFTIEELLYIIYSLSNAVDFIRKTTLARIPFEAAILKLTQRASMISLDKMLEKVKAAEKSFPANNPAVPDRNDPAAANSPRAPKTDSGDKKPVGEHSADKASDKSATPVKSSDFAEIANSWTIILNYIKTKKISVASYLAEAYPVSLESNILSIGIPKQFQFNKEVLESLENRRLIEEAARVVLGIDIRVTLVSIESANTPRGQTAESAEDEIDSPGEQRDDFVKREAEPIVNAALEIFGGRIAIDKNSKRKE